MDSLPLLDFKNGLPGLLISICVILSLQLVFKVGEFLWKLREKKDSASEAAIRELTEVVKHNILATEHLEQRLNELKNTLSEIPKFKSDMRRLFSAIKIVSGDKWSQIRKEIMEEESSV